MEDYQVSGAIKALAGYLLRYYGKKVIILLDEYDTPMQEAYVNGYWDEMVAFTRSMFNATFKTNPYLERAVMTGITRVSRESIFSDLNNLEVVTTTSEKYADCFGFTEKEVFQALDEYGRSEGKEEVKRWYDGFTFGSHKDIYNPWSILNYLDKGKVAPYWANSSSNSLVGKLIREGNVCFYHGFVLGLMVELSGRYILTSNRESGFGRYDVMLEPRRTEDDGIILEFKVQDAEDEKELSDTVKEALAQIDRQKYEAMLVEKGVPREKIRKYGFAFSGKRVLIG